MTTNGLVAGYLLGESECRKTQTFVNKEKAFSIFGFIASGILSIYYLIIII